MSPLGHGWDNGHTFPDLNARKGRYGAAYVADVCAHFGVGVEENRPDEDFLAVDMGVQFTAGTIRVQVKCTASNFSSKDPHLTIPAEKGWVEAWSKSILPTYLIAVQVPQDPQIWVNYDGDHETYHATSAYWARVDQLDWSQAHSVQLPIVNRFTPETLRDWNSELQALFKVVKS